MESAEIWRRWAAISTIAAALQQKVWATTHTALYPNMYVFLVGQAGTGKSVVINAAQQLLKEVPDFHFGATSMTMASLTDHMKDAKVVKIRLGQNKEPLEFNSLTVVADELSAFMHDYAGDLIAGLTKFYDCSDYSQSRRGADIRIKIDRPQLNILSGTTPTNLVYFIPEYAWEQGFTSRIILVFSDESNLIDIFNAPKHDKPTDLIHDLKLIADLSGECVWNTEWATAMNNWQAKKFDPVPSHPKLRRYNNRRRAHVMKLSMISCVDRGSKLELTKDDFNRAMSWLLEAEHAMPRIFEQGVVGQDSQAIDEIRHFIRSSGTISYGRIVSFARTKVRYAPNIPKIIQVMEDGGIIEHVGNDRLGLKIYKATDE